MLLLALPMLALAAPGARTDGVVPAVTRGEGSLSVWYDPTGLDASGFIAAGWLGLGQSVGVELAAGAPLEGRALIAEARVASPVLGARADPRLSIWGGVDYGRIDANDGGALDTIWGELGLVAGLPVIDRVRIYAAATANGAPDHGAINLWIEPAVGVSWRPQLSPKLAALVGVEAWGSTDFESVTFGPLITLGISGTSQALR